MLFELLHKRVPYQGRRIADVRRNMQMNKPYYKLDLDAQIKELIVQMLQRDHYKRPSLQEILEHESLREFYLEILKKWFPKKKAEIKRLQALSEKASNFEKKFEQFPAQNHNSIFLNSKHSVLSKLPSQNGLQFEMKNRPFSSNKDYQISKNYKQMKSFSKKNYYLRGNIKSQQYYQNLPQKKEKSQFEFKSEIMNNVNENINRKANLFNSGSKQRSQAVLIRRHLSIDTGPNMIKPNWLDNNSKTRFMSLKKNHRKQKPVVKLLGLRGSENKLLVSNKMKNPVYRNRKIKTKKKNLRKKIEMLSKFNKIKRKINHQNKKSVTVIKAPPNLKKTHTKKAPKKVSNIYPYQVKMEYYNDNIIFEDYIPFTKKEISQKEISKPIQHKIPQRMLVNSKTEFNVKRSQRLASKKLIEHRNNRDEKLQRNLFAKRISPGPEIINRKLTRTLRSEMFSPTLKIPEENSSLVLLNNASNENRKLKQKSFKSIIKRKRNLSLFEQVSQSKLEKGKKEDLRNYSMENNTYDGVIRSAIRPLYSKSKILQEPSKAILMNNNLASGMRMRMTTQKKMNIFSCLNQGDQRKTVKTSKDPILNKSESSLILFTNKQNEYYANLKQRNTQGERKLAAERRNKLISNKKSLLQEYKEKMQHQNSRLDLKTYYMIPEHSKSFLKKKRV